MNNKINSSYKVIADHLRSSAFLIADGVLPSNEGRGYVLRRIMRRALLHCNKLNPSQAFFYKLVPSLIAEMSKAYPELRAAQSLIEDSLKTEEGRFRQTLDKGMDILNESLKGFDSSSKNSKFDGKVAFKLYDTYGFPLDLTQNILKEKDIQVDVEAFDGEMAKQKKMAKESWSGSGSAADESLYFDLKERFGATEFLMYETEKSSAKIISIIKDAKEVQDVKDGDKDAEIILDQTPFYATSGGQRGDEGIIKSSPENEIHISQTIKKADSLFVHKVSKVQGEFKVGDKVEAIVTNRDTKAKNHSATHLLHYVLRKKFGEQLTQKGSDVASNSFTFDFNHNSQIKKEDLDKIEDEINELISQNSEVKTQVMDLKSAKEKGAVALFGEKYADTVRVLSMASDKSIEFCGGTHVKQTGDIGLFKIVSEKSVAAGIRRITAKTSDGATAYVQEVLEKLNSEITELKDKLTQRCKENNIESEVDLKGIKVDFHNNEGVKKVVEFRVKSKELEVQIVQLQEKLKKINKEIDKLKKEKLTGGDISFSAQSVGGINLIHHFFEDLNAKDLRDVITSEKSKKENSENTAIVFFSSFEEKIAVALAISVDLNKTGIIAGKIIPQIVEKIGGKGGGGRPDIAFGGGNNKNGISEAVEALKLQLEK